MDQDHQQHRHEEVYSAQNPIPRVRSFFQHGFMDLLTAKDESASESEDEASETDDEPISASTSSASQSPTYEGVPEQQVQQSKENKRRARKKPRRVTDPITRQDIMIRDISRREYRDAMESDDRRDSNERPSDNNDLPKKGFPRRQTQNIVNQAFPPVERLPSSMIKLHPYLLPLWVAYSVALFWSVRSWLIALPLIACNAWLFDYVWRLVVDNRDIARWDRERKRGENARSGDQDAAGASNESAEWLNGLVAQLWDVMDPAIFSSLGSTLEDVMQVSMPSFIHAVKVVDVAQGFSPVRIAGLRILPDQESSDLRTRIDGDDGSKNSQDGVHPDERPYEETGGAYVNLEISFIYRATNEAQGNAHLLINFFVGLKKWTTFPLPVLVEIKGMIGTVRLRLQLTPDAPFVKNVTMTFRGLPRVEVHVSPLRVNTSNIPILSGFIRRSINAAIEPYVTPGSLTMDLGSMIAGDDIKREIDALGLLFVVIHSARDLEKQDRRGSSDPYCTIALSKHAKILYATRVVVNDLSPRWEEQHAILLHADMLRIKEKVSIALWDSDRFTADDVLGRVEVDLLDVFSAPGRMHLRESELMGVTNSAKKEGTLKYSVGFFPRSSQISAVREQHKTKSNANVADVKDAMKAVTSVAEPSREGRSAGALDQAAQDHLTAQRVSQQASKQEWAATEAPPDASHTIGIVSIQIHNIVGLEVIDTHTHRSPRNAWAAGQNVSEVQDEDDTSDAPSSYCTVIMNDQSVFQSRVKALTHAPFFTAGVERLVGDWRRTMIMVVVRDRRLREADPILGVVPIRLDELLLEAGSSQVTRFFPLAGGVGRGSIKLSILFRSVEGLTGVKQKLGWDVATVQVHSPPSVTSCTDEEVRADLKHAAVRFRTLLSSHRISHRTAVVEGDKLTWGTSAKYPLKVPTRRRYAAPFVVEFHTRGAVRRRLNYMSILWLQDVPDDEMKEYVLPVWHAKEGGDFHKLRQNYHLWDHEDEAREMGVEKVAELSLRLRLKSGVGQSHVKLDRHGDAALIMDAWRCCLSAGLRRVGGDFVTSAHAEDSGEEDNNDDDEDTVSEGDDTDGEEAPAWHGMESPPPWEDDIDSHDRVGRIGSSSVKRSSSERRPHTWREKLHRWTDERKELHRQHRGIKQYKPARTASWMSNGASKTLSKARRHFSLDERHSPYVETET